MAWFDPNQPDPARGPLMSGLDHIGLAEGLAGLRLDLNGYVEVGYTYNPDHDSGDDIFGRVFDDEHGHHVQLDQLDLALERRVGRLRGRWDVGGALEVVYGYDTFRFHANGLDFYSDCEDHDDGNVEDDHTDPSLQFDLLQAYADVNLPVGRGLILRAGKFVTPLGYETIDPARQPLVLAELHVRLRQAVHAHGADGQLPVQRRLAGVGRRRARLGPGAGGQQRRASYIGRIDYTAGDRWELHFGFITGPENDDCDCDCPTNNDRYRTLVDLTAGYQVNDRLRLGAEVLYGYDGAADNNANAANWYGAAGYVAYRIDRRLTLNGRLEGFYDGDGTRLQTGEDLGLYSATVGLAIVPFPGHAVGSRLSVRPEVRYDHADAPEFDGGTESDQVTLGVDVLFTF